MKTLRFLSALLLMTGVVISSCSKSGLEPEQEPQNPKNPVSTVKTYKVTVKTNGGVDTKATLEESGSNLSFTWKEGDKLTVTKEGTEIGTLTATKDGKTTTFEGTLSGNIAEGNTLVLSYMCPSYNYQDGTLDYIANHCDYATSTVSVTSVNNDVITTTAANFTLQQAIVKFTLKNKVGGAALNPTTLTLRTEGMSDVVITPTSSTNVLYAALPAFTNKNFTMKAVVNGDIYYFQVAGVSFESTKYYTRTVYMASSSVKETETPLTLEALNDNTTVTFSKYSGVQYSINGGTKTDVPSSGIIPTLNSGDKVSFYGNNISYDNSVMPGYSGSPVIACDKDCYIYGNILSLMYSDSFATATTIGDTYAFRYFFYNNSHIVNHSEYDLVLPATNLTTGCYYGMFYLCTGLTRTVELPATTLTQSCYHLMYYCCTSLTAAPKISASRIETSSFYQMFSGCANLKYVKCLATSMVTNSTFNWLSGVSGSGVFVKDANMNDWPSGASGIPSGWTVQNN